MPMPMPMIMSVLMAMNANQADVLTRMPIQRARRRPRELQRDEKDDNHGDEAKHAKQST